MEVLLWIGVLALFVLTIVVASHRKSTTGTVFGTPIICPNQNCGYKGAAKKVARANAFVGIILCLFFLLPGLIYFIVRGGYRYECPECGLQIKTD